MIIKVAPGPLRDPQYGGHPAKRGGTRQDTRTGPQRESPYTVKNLDGAIAHLEAAIAVDGNIAIFGRRYWRDRVQQIRSTPGILPLQSRRLQYLLHQLAVE